VNSDSIHQSLLNWWCSTICWTFSTFWSLFKSSLFQHFDDTSVNVVTTRFWRTIVKNVLFCFWDVLMDMFSCWCDMSFQLAWTNFITVSLLMISSFYWTFTWASICLAALVTLIEFLLNNIIKSSTKDKLRLDKFTFRFLSLDFNRIDLPSTTFISCVETLFIWWILICQYTGAVA